MYRKEGEVCACSASRADVYIVKKGNRGGERGRGRTTPSLEAHGDELLRWLPERAAESFAAYASSSMCMVCVFELYVPTDSDECPLAEILPGHEALGGRPGGHDSPGGAAQSRRQAQAGL